MREDLVSWWIDESWPGPVELTLLEELALLYEIANRSYDHFGKALFSTFNAYGTSVADAYKGLTRAFEPVLIDSEPRINPNKNGPVFDSVRSLTVLHGRIRVAGNGKISRCNQVRRGNSWRPQRQRAGSRRS